MISVYPNVINKMHKCIVDIPFLSREDIMKKTSSGKGQKQSNVIKPGTGSGIGVKAGSTKTATSAPDDKHGLGRKPSSKVLK